MQEQHIATAKFGQHPGDIRCVNRSVCAGEEDDAVLPSFFDLNNCMPGWNFGVDPDKAGINARLPEGIQQKAAIGADFTRVHDRSAGSGQGNALIQSLAAAVDGKGIGGDGLARQDKVIHMIGFINIQRAKVKNSMRCPPMSDLLR